MTLEQLKEVLEHHFSEPFLARDYVRARFIESTAEKTLQINIGRRDIWLNEKGEVTGAGTYLIEKVA